MKKFFTLCVLSLLLAVGSASARIFQVGVRAGAGITSYKIPSTALGDARLISTGSQFTYGFAVAARLSIPKFISIQPEVEYNISRYGYKLYENNIGRKFNVNVQRVEIPVLVGVNIKAFRIFAGPSFRLAKFQSSSLSGFKASYNDSDIAGVFGLGFDIKKFFVDVRYKTYFGSVHNTFKYDGNSTKVKVSTDSRWTVNLGFFF